MEAVQLDDGGDEAQAKPHASSIAALVGTIEASHDRFPFTFSDAGAGVRDSDDALICLSDQRKRYGSALGRDDGIVDQICHCFGRRLRSQKTCVLLQ